MPIQKNSDEFIQFIYQPDYLQDERSISLQTNPDIVCQSIGITPRISDIKLDGGNVIRGEDWVILTDKIFSENRGWTRQNLLFELEKLFEAKPIIIPKEPYDIIGHADGLVRYYNNNTVLINEYNTSAISSFGEKLKKSLIKEGLKTINIPHNAFYNKGIEAHGYYINYLHMKNFILLPLFDLPEDKQVIKLFEQLFPQHAIESIRCKEISAMGGVLNCITWNINAPEASAHRSKTY